jgi:hypothetical protein
MTHALCNVGSVAARLAGSRLATSTLWRQPIDKIEPMQLHAFIVRASLEGHESQAVNEIQAAQIEVHKAVESGQIVRPRLLDYERPTHKLLTVSELKNGLARMSRARAQAVLFGLETRQSIEAVVALKWTDLAGMPALTQLAANTLKAQPRHLRTDYVFWEPAEGQKPMPVFGLERDVFDRFGCVWAELLTGYKHMLLIDYEGELKRWQSLIPALTE